MELSTHIHGEALHVELKGKFTFSDNPQFRAVIESLADADIQQVVLHMGEVEFVDSAALGMLLLAHDEAKKHHKSISIKHVNGQVKRILQLARFEELFSL